MHFLIALVHTEINIKPPVGQLETVEMETGNGKWKRKTETVKT